MEKYSDIYTRLRELCAESGIIRPGDCVVVAFSGGLDSTVLLDLLRRWESDGGNLRLVACHYNHKLRAEADAEQGHVESECERMSVPCVVGGGDVAGEAERRGVSEHVAGREMRYDFLLAAAADFFSGTRDCNRVVVATAHHRDDQVETVLMRLLAGAGVEGMTGIRRTEIWKGHSSHPIVRPLLDFSREEIEDYCRRRGLKHVEDASNRDVHYPRNRLRHEIIPLLRSGFGDSAVSGVVRTAELSRLTADLLCEEVDKAVIKTATDRRDGEIVLDYSRFSSYLTILRLNILKRAVQMLAGHGLGIAFERYRTADRYFSTGGTGIVELASGVRMTRWREKLYVYSSLESDWKRPLGPDETVEIPGFGQLEARLQTREASVLPPPKGTQYCDYDKIGSGSCLVRPAGRGDRMIPCGMSGRRKVSDILREAGIPPHRRRYPVVVSRDRIAAVPPFRVAEQFKLGDATRRVLALRFIERKNQG